MPRLLLLYPHTAAAQLARHPAWQVCALASSRARAQQQGCTLSCTIMSARSHPRLDVSVRDAQLVQEGEATGHIQRHPAAAAEGGSASRQCWMVDSFWVP